MPIPVQSRASWTTHVCRPTFSVEASDVLGVRESNRCGMTRAVDLQVSFDTPLSSVGNEVPDVLLGVVSSWGVCTLLREFHMVGELERP